MTSILLGFTQSQIYIEKPLLRYQRKYDDDKSYSGSDCIPLDHFQNRSVLFLYVILCTTFNYFMRKKGRRGSTCHSIFRFTNFSCFRCTESILKKYGYWYGYGYVRNTDIFSTGTGTGTGSFPLRVRKYGRGTG